VAARVLHDGWKLPTVQNQGRVWIGSRCKFRCLDFPICLWVDTAGKISIGEGSYLNQGVTLAAREAIEIGPHSRIGEHVAIHDTSFHPVTVDEAPKTAPVKIGRNVWIGHRAIILPGTEIGDHSVIGAGAVVTGAIPEKCVAVGIPARVVRQFDCPDDWRRP
jgi:acetyltransferase-like isoleucine patch superfamily enzyme